MQYTSVCKKRFAVQSGEWHGMACSCIAYRLARSCNNIICTHLTAFNLNWQFGAIQPLHIQSPALLSDVKWLRDLMVVSCFGKIVALGTWAIDRKNSTLYLRYGWTSSDWQLLFQETYGCPLKTITLLTLHFLNKILWIKSQSMWFT